MLMRSIQTKSNAIFFNNINYLNVSIDLSETSAHKQGEMKYICLSV
jgi:hypothetical protein